MRTFGFICAVAVFLVFLVALAFALEVGGLQWKSYFGPKHAAVDREVFKETRSYNEAKVQALIKYRREYVRSDEEGKAGLAGLIRLEFAEFYLDGKSQDLPAELRSFLNQIMAN